MTTTDTHFTARQLIKEAIKSRLISKQVDSYALIAACSVEDEEAFEDLLIGQIGGPAVGGEDGFVKIWWE